MAGRKKMWLVSVDKKGHELPDGKWVDIPAPDSFPTNGFRHIQDYVARLLQSRAGFASIVISTPDEQVSVGIWNQGGVPYFSIGIRWRANPELESEIRKFFSTRKLDPVEDYLYGNATVSDASRKLLYKLPPDSNEIAALTKDCLREVYGLPESAALDFYFEE